MAKQLSIAVYNDLGTTSLCVKQLFECLQRVFPEANIHHVDGPRAREALQRHSMDLFCVGGGFARGVVKSLGEAGLDSLSKFVHSGGAYLGLCSGAYLAAGLIRFDAGGPLEVIDGGFLNFYPG